MQYKWSEAKMEMVLHPGYNNNYGRKDLRHGEQCFYKRFNHTQVPRPRTVTGHATTRSRQGNSTQTQACPVLVVVIMDNQIWDPANLLENSQYTDLAAEISPSQTPPQTAAKWASKITLPVPKERRSIWKGGKLGAKLEARPNARMNSKTTSCLDQDRRSSCSVVALQTWSSRTATSSAISSPGTPEAEVTCWLTSTITKRLPLKWPSQTRELRRVVSIMCCVNSSLSNSAYFDYIPWTFCTKLTFTIKLNLVVKFHCFC